MSNADNMLTPDEPESDYTVTCRSAGCGNAGTAITVEAAAVEPAVVCGVCGHPILDITPA